MGTDIHLFVEYQEPHPVLGLPGPWMPAHVSEFSLPRYYELFDRLAGARGGKPVHKARGIPSTVSRHVERKMQDYHTETYLTRDEFTTVCREFAEENGLNKDCWFAAEVIISFMDALRYDGYNTRIVIAFDN